MSYIEANSIIPYLFKSKIIGHGVDSICFLMPNGEVLKLFKNSGRSKLLLTQKNDNGTFEDKLEKISEISNGTFIGPTNLIHVRKKFRAYTMPYIDGVLLSKVDENVRISDLFINYYNVLDDIYNISENHLELFDLSIENVFLTRDYKYKVIDLDRCHFKNNVSTKRIYINNVRQFYNKILWTIFDTKDDEYPIFNNYELQKFFLNKINPCDINMIYEMLDKFSSLCFLNNPTIADARKMIKVNNYHNDYHK